MPGIADIVDAVGAEIAAHWSPSGNDEVIRRDFDNRELDGLAGRKVWLFDRGESEVEKAARGASTWEYRVRLVVAEPYTAAGGMPGEWIDERTQWVRETIVTPLGNERRRPVLQANPFARACWPHRAEVLDGVDPEGKRYEKLFLVQVEIDYRRTVRV